MGPCATIHQNDMFDSDFETCYVPLEPAQGMLGWERCTILMYDPESGKENNYLFCPNVTAGSGEPEKPDPTSPIAPTPKGNQIDTVTQGRLPEIKTKISISKQNLLQKYSTGYTEFVLSLLILQLATMKQKPQISELGE